MSNVSTRKNLLYYVWIISYLILLFIVVCAGWFTTGYLGDKARREILEYNESEMSSHSSHLTSEFEKIERAVKSLSGSPWIAPALISRKERDIANANSALDRYNSSMGSSVSYLMDGNGMTIASSNRNDSDSFVGKSYQFRPYFTQAIKGAPGRYFALGATSFKRGFYASYSVRESKGQIIGVVVIKQNVDAEEAHLVKYPYYFVVDPNGIIFLSGRKEMNFKSLWPVSRETQIALLKSKQFGEKEFTAVLPREVADGMEITFDGRNYLASRKVINPEGWSIVLMTTTERVLIYRLAGVVITILICTFIIVPLIINYKTSRSAEMVRQSEKRFRRLFERNLAGVYRTSIDGRLLDCNNAFARIYGYESREEIMQHTAVDLHVGPEARQEYIAALQAEGMLLDFEIQGRRKDGSLIWLLENVTLIHGEEDGLTEMEGTLVDITDRKHAEDALGESEKKYRLVLEANPDPIIVYDIEGKAIYLNPAFTSVFGWSLEERIGKKMDDFVPEESWPETRMMIDMVIAGKNFSGIETCRLTREGKMIPVSISGSCYRNQEGNMEASVINLRDITERKRVEAEKKKLEEQYRQAQKMEAIGQLAGGVAHDFNNMLNIILGYSQMALMKIETSGPLYTNIQEIMNAARRSADLVRQLLAFARKQTIAPKALDLNDTVAGMLNMLRKLIGENIDLLWMPAANLWSVKMDPAQIDQILANLAVNARDSISGVGKVTIETGKAEFDEAYCAQYTDFVPGQYVLLAVSDNGCGMDKETLEQIFEPFFTTKEVGKGTGMGLATVYGIIRQNNGFINVYSEPGKGSTFKIYLPRFEEEGTAIDEPRAQAKPLTGTETVLLVEDEEALIKMGKMMLEELGYTVLAAGSPNEAIKLAGQYAGDIHLVLTDVVMPEMSGRDLMKRLSDLRPGIKCLFMSGYTANVIAHRGILDEGVNFLQKPFFMNELAAKVREAMGKG